jgi:arylsulfatase A-like enzyme
VSSEEIVHDAEFYVSRAANREAWDTEDQEMDERLAELERQHGRRPNIIHIMWDDMAFGDLGIPAMKAIRGFDTPNIDRIAQEGILFTRMYTEPSCTPSRAAVLTGRHPVRSGMSSVGWPLEFGGISGDEVTTANVLSDAGYATAFYSKWHLGDIEESYPHNQGFDEALFNPYNQVSDIWDDRGDAVNAALNVAPHLRKAYPYLYDQDALNPDGWVMAIEGKKGEQGREWKEPSSETYTEIDLESERRMLDFIERQVEAETPFFATYWPLMLNFFPRDPHKKTLQWGLIAEGLKRLDEFIGQLLDKLEELGVAGNTLLVCHADNGPMVHDPPAGMGLTETIFRGGKGDYTEGGVRVPAFAWWPGVIQPGQIVNDIIHETDLFTTFARVGGAKEHVPTDRVIDGVDQTSLLLSGDEHGRRDYVHIYVGETLGATCKGRVKRHWITEGLESGVSSAFYDLVLDPREKVPLLVPMVHTYSQFDRIRARHELWIEKYPNRAKARGIPFTGLSNARPETTVIGERLEALRKDLPFDPFEFMDWEPPAGSQPMNVVD